MSFLIIKRKDDRLADPIQIAIVTKNDVSAIYSEADAVVQDPLQDVGGTVVLLMNSGKEFKFKYSHYSTASISCVILAQAIQFESAAEIEI
jgi:hypothetical protein